MGNFTEHQPIQKNENQNSNFLSKLIKLPPQNFPQWGQVNVYQLDQKPYNYFLEYTENSIGDEQSLQQKVVFYKNLPQNKNIVPVEFTQIIKSDYYLHKFAKIDFCKPFDILRVFCSYYNFTLEKAIELKIKQKSQFSESDILYVLRSLISIGKFYQDQLNSNFYTGIFKTKNIFISPQGHIKVYPFNSKVYQAYLKKKYNKKQEQNQSKLMIGSNDQFFKTTSLTRDQSMFSKNGFRADLKKSKIKTTNKLKKQSIDLLKTQQILQLKGIDSKIPISLRPSNQSLLFSRQQSIQTISQNLNIKSHKCSKRKDLFELGILVMQLLFLNDQHYYYKHNQQKNHITIQQKEREPNFDLIKFSLKNLLPKRNVSAFLLSLIEKLLGKRNQQELNFQQIYYSIEKEQQLSKKANFCLRFQVEDSSEIKLNDFYKLSGQYSYIKDKQDSNKKVQKSSILKVYSKQKLQVPQEMKKIINFSTKLESLFTKNNLSRSVIIEDENFSSETDILSRLKSSRKLIPHKIRSVSTKNSQSSRN